jgi:hypothetical protein
MDLTLKSTDDALVEIRTDGDGWWTNTPWWLVSAGIHLVVLLAATLVSIERLMAVNEPPVIVSPALPGVQAMVSELPPDFQGFERAILRSEEESQFESKEAPIFDPMAEVSDHNETPDNEDYGQRKGDSLEYEGTTKGFTRGIGRLDSKLPGSHTVMGIGDGGGGGGQYGGPYGGRFRLRADGKVGRKGTPGENAVTAALKWLARHQNPDGSWGATNHIDSCTGVKCAGAGDPEFDAGVTGLSLLAFLGAGYTHLSKDELSDTVNPGRKLRFGDTVKSGLKWLMAHQDPEGCIGGRGTKFMYNHTIAALALSEAYGMTATQSFKGPAQQAIDFILAARNPDRAWRYTKQPGDNDTSVTGWAIMALKSAELSELKVAAADAYAGTRKWLDEAANTSAYYRTGYNSRDSGKVFVPNRNEQFEDHPSMTAVSVLCRIFMTKDRNDPGLTGAHLLLQDLPVSKPNYTDYYYWYYASLALYQLDGPSGPKWGKWDEAMKNALVPYQKTGKDGCANGSWTSEDDRWGFEGGRVYATAINALTLEVYYRYANVFRGSR